MLFSCERKVTSYRSFVSNLTRPAAVVQNVYLGISLINVYKTFYLNNFKCKSPDKSLIMVRTIDNSSETANTHAFVRKSVLYV